MSSLSKRSSFASGAVTSLIGWNGLVVLVALLAGWRGAPWALFGAATATALIEVLVLWPLYFTRLRLDRRAVARGALGGALTGLVAFAPWVAVLGGPPGAAVVWVATSASAGAAVGGFLAYFFADDARLASERVETTRDAHWLEPFVFGTAVFAAVCLPRSVDAAVYTALVGAFAGVVAAGVSHFSPDAWKASLPHGLALCVVGAVVGAGVAFLLRHQAVTLATAPTAGAITFAVTLLRGQALAAREVSELRGS
jgi:hypothetical protein